MIDFTGYITKGRFPVIDIRSVLEEQYHELNAAHELLEVANVMSFSNAPTTFYFSRTVNILRQRAYALTISNLDDFSLWSQSCKLSGYDGARAVPNFNDVVEVENCCPHCVSEPAETDFSVKGGSLLFS